MTHDLTRSETSAATRQTGRLAALRTDWLPLALLGGDAVIVVASIAGAYLYHHTIDPLHTEGTALPFTPYVAAIPRPSTISTNRGAGGACQICCSAFTVESGSRPYWSLPPSRSATWARITRVW